MKPISRSDCATTAYSGRCELRLDRIDVDLHRAELADEHEIVAAAVVRVAEDHAVRERLHERRDLALHRLGVALVELHEQRDDAARIEVVLHDVEELLRVERRRALHPRIERIRRHRVELLIASSG